MMFWVRRGEDRSAAVRHHFDLSCSTQCLNDWHVAQKLTIAWAKASGRERISRGTILHLALKTHIKVMTARLERLGVDVSQILADTKQAKPERKQTRCPARPAIYP